MYVEQKFIATGEAATVKYGTLPYYKTTFTFEMVAINISYFSFRKLAVWTPYEYLSLLKKKYCPECKCFTHIRCMALWSKFTLCWCLCCFVVGVS